MRSIKFGILYKQWTRRMFKQNWPKGCSAVCYNWLLLTKVSELNIGDEFVTKNLCSFFFFFIFLFTCRQRSDWQIIPSKNYRLALLNWSGGPILEGLGNWSYFGHSRKIKHQPKPLKKSIRKELVSDFCKNSAYVLFSFSLQYTFSPLGDEK